MLETVDTQFDDLLNASYHQDGQKLLATNRYLQKRFDNPAPDSVINGYKTADSSISTIEAPTTKSSSSAKAKDITL
ncbi:MULTISPECIES: hypothetical protein [unclassified Psychrobacter]|uniref:hypothetical protein n=1 Tax=unclassified Psychrobacter TaxID=196806 RepID=UPI004037C336